MIPSPICKAWADLLGFGLKETGTLIEVLPGTNVSRDKPIASGRRDITAQRRDAGQRGRRATARRARQETDKAGSTPAASTERGNDPYTEDGPILILSRRKGEAIVVADGITITLVEIRGNTVRLGIEAPTEVPVWRHEIWTTIQEDKRNEERQARDTAARDSVDIGEPVG